MKAAAGDMPLRSNIRRAPSDASAELEFCVAKTLTNINVIQKSPGVTICNVSLFELKANPKSVSTIKANGTVCVVVERDRHSINKSLDATRYASYASVKIELTGVFYRPFAFRPFAGTGTFSSSSRLSSFRIVPLCSVIVRSANLSTTPTSCEAMITVAPA